MQGVVDIDRVKKDPSFLLLCQRRWRSCVVLFALAVLPFCLMFFFVMNFNADTFSFLREQDSRHIWCMGGMMMIYFLSLSALHVFVANNYHEDVNTQVEFVLTARGNHY